MEQTANSQLPRSHPHIKIRQQNLNKSLTTQSDMLQLLDPDNYDIATIHEPYLEHNHNSQASHNWFTLYPKEHYAVCMLLCVGVQVVLFIWGQWRFHFHCSFCRSWCLFFNVFSFLQKEGMQMGRLCTWMQM